MNREEWLEYRKTFIGGSDVYRILSGDALGVYCEKRDLVESTADNEWLRMGRRLERSILEEYAERNGYTLEFPSDPIIHPDLPWLGGTLDAIAVTPDGDRLVVDSKNVDLSKSKLWGAEDSDEAPEQYVVQVNHYCGIGGFFRGDLAALIGGNRFKSIRIPYDAELFATALPLLDEFWHHNVLKGIPPDADFSNKNAVDLQKALHKGFGPPVVLSNDVLSYALAYARMGRAEKLLDAGKKKLQAMLRAELGDASSATIEGTDVKLVRTFVKGGMVQAFERKPGDRFSVKVPDGFENDTILPSELAGLLEETS
jgi:predicted phage-related endonuclease